MIRHKNHGFQFLELIRLEECEIDQYQPVAGSYAVIKCQGKFLFCYNTWRKQWELPAGKREGRESPKACAMRELYEETGQMVTEMDFIGLMVKHISNGTLKYNPVYGAMVEKLIPFVENEETSGIMLWDTEERVEVIDAVDLCLVKEIK
ncbi:NUDIX domain-containing protein [Bacillus sp. FSL W7-1360]